MSKAINEQIAGDRILFETLTVHKEGEAAAKLTGDASIGLLLRHLSSSRLISIAQIEGRVRGVGSEFVLACDMRFAARDTAIFAQFEPSFGVIPGAGGAQHLARFMGRGRALEVMLSAGNYDADLAKRYGWINRALPAAELSDFVKRWPIESQPFPSWATLSLRSVSTRSAFRASRTSVAILMSSSRARARMSFSN